MINCIKYLHNASFRSKNKVRKRLKFQKSEAIVIKNFALNNDDVIVTLITPFYGKISVVAPKGKRSFKKFASSIDIINRVEIEYSFGANEGLGKILNIDLTESYDLIKQDFKKIMLATYFIDLVQHFHAEKMPLENTYKLLSMTLTYMNTKAPLGSMLEAFQIKLLCAVGLKIPTKKCSTCGTDIINRADKNISYAFNEIFCHDCCTTKNIKTISYEALEFVRMVAYSPVKDFLGISAPEKTKKELANYLDFHIDAQLNRHLVSRDLLEL